MAFKQISKKTCALTEKSIILKPYLRVEEKISCQSLSEVVLEGFFNALNLRKRL
jgi:hypothetical protein